jgi:ankyrin repeat protein
MSKVIFKMANLFVILFLFTSFIGCSFITGEKPIHKAAYKGNLKKVKKIIERDPAQINVQDRRGFTPLHLASGKGHTAIVEFLITHNANIELGNHMNERPLAQAAKFGHYSTVRTLLEHGAKVTCEDDFGRTPLHEASVWGDKEVVDILLSYGADVSARDQYNNTPLHQAAMQGNIEAAKALVEHGSDIFAKNYYDYRKPAEKWEVPPSRDTMNKTPKEIALKAGFKELAQYLQTKEIEKGSILLP